VVQDERSYVNKLERENSKHKAKAHLYEEKYKAVKAMLEEANYRNDIAYHRLAEISTPDELFMRKVKECCMILKGDISQWTRQS
jgi:hypothetical protein